MKGSSSFDRLPQADVEGIELEGGDKELSLKQIMEAIQCAKLP